MASNETIREHCERRLEALRADRSSWFTHWQELAEYILPRKQRFLISPNAQRGGAGMNKKIFDPTGTTAARICAAGLMGGVTSPARPWFRLTIGKISSEGEGEIAVWLAEVERRMELVLAQSNIYNCLANCHLDNVVFGVGPMYIYEDNEDVVRGHNPAIGEFFVGVDHRGYPSSLYREFTMTARNAEKEFEKENLSTAAQSLLAQQGDKEIVICHAIEPDTYRWTNRPFYECYWERGSERGKILRKRGYAEQPFIVPRWEVVSNDAYSTSPGMDALPEIKQLQHETNRKGQAIDKMVSPPLVADVQLRNQPVSLLPGGVSYVSGASQIGVKPIFQVQPPIQEMMGDIQEIQDRIKTILFNDLFMMISNLDTVRSATEIDARREEKLIMIGPVLGRIMNEALDPLINRVFGIMWRGRLLPQPPESVKGAEIKVQYISMLAEAQSATKTVGIERLFGFVGTLAAGIPDIMDKVDPDKAVDHYARSLRVPPDIIRDNAQVTELRNERQEQQQVAQILEQTNAGAQAAKTMSQAEIGGGQNALSAMIGGAGAIQ